MGRGDGTRSHPLPLFLLVSHFVTLSLSDQSLVFGATSPVAPASSVSTKPGQSPLPSPYIPPWFLFTFLPLSLFLSFLSPLLPSLDPGLVSSFLLSFHTPLSFLHSHTLPILEVCSLHLRLRPLDRIHSVPELPVHYCILIMRFLSVSAGSTEFSEGDSCSSRSQMRGNELFQEVPSNPDPASERFLHFFLIGQCLFFQPVWNKISSCICTYTHAQEYIHTCMPTCLLA